MLKAATLCSLPGELIGEQHLKSAPGITIMRVYVVYDVRVGSVAQASVANFLFAHTEQVFLLGAPGEETVSVQLERACWK